MNTKSVKTKLFLILALLGAIPFIAAIAFIGWRSVTHMEQHTMTDNWNKNLAIKEHLSQELDKNFYVLRSLSVSPAMKIYLTDPANHHVEEILTKLLKSSNYTFQDTNPIAVTDLNGLQLIRTDDAPHVNTSSRKYFQEAAAGHEYVSDAMIAMSTGEQIFVQIVPVYNDSHRVIGTVQRNLSLERIQNFLDTQNTDELDIIIMDREDNVIISTEDETYAKGKSMSGEVRQISETLNWEDGLTRLNLNGEDCVATFSRDQRTGWSIVTISPYSRIVSTINDVIARGAILGLLLMLLVNLVAYMLASRIARPLQDINKVVSNMATGDAHAHTSQTHDYSDDELGEISQAINEMRQIHESLSREAKTDKLTGLFNQYAVEEICRRKLREYEEAANPGLIAICIVDIDHFKRANREEGHNYGDRILQEFARCLKSSFSEQDCIGRLEADEFIVVLANQPDRETIMKKAAQINEIARNVIINGEKAGLTASIGVAIAPYNGKTYNHLFHAADLALYDVKENARDSYKLADE